MVRIVTDSTSDLITQIASELAITIVPLYVHFGTETYRDGVDLVTEDFYRKPGQSEVLPTTSSANPGAFTEVYDRLAEETDEILTITISSKLSATYENTVRAKEMWQGKARLEIIDSKSAIVGLGLITTAAAKAAQSGSSLNEVIDVTKDCMQRVDFRLAFDTLEYLKKGGV